MTAVGRQGSKRVAQLLSDGGVVLETGERAAMVVADRLDEDAAYDLVLVTMYDHQVEAALPALSRSRAAAIQFMFVTFDAERLATAVGRDRCSFGMPAVTARLSEAGRLSPKVSARQKTLHGDPRWKRLFEESRMPSAYDADMPLWLRCHVPLTVAMESVSVAGVHRGGAASWGRAWVIARGLRAGYAIIRGAGDPIHPRSKRVIAALPLVLMTSLLRLLSSFRSFRELLAGGAEEACALARTMMAAALSATPSMHAAATIVGAMTPEVARADDHAGAAAGGP